MTLKLIFRSFQTTFKLSVVSKRIKKERSISLKKPKFKINLKKVPSLNSIRRKKTRETGTFIEFSVVIMHFSPLNDISQALEIWRIYVYFWVKILILILFELN